MPIDQFTSTQQQAYGRILRFLTDTRQKVETTLRHVYREKIEWSPQYKHSKDVKRLWNQLKKYRMQHQTGNHASLTTIHRLMRQTKLNDALLATTGEIEVYRLDTCTKFKAVHKQAKVLNGAHLITVDQANAQANGTTEASEKKIRLYASQLNVIWVDP